MYSAANRRSPDWLGSRLLALGPNVSAYAILGTRHVSDGGGTYSVVLPVQSAGALFWIDQRTARTASSELRTLTAFCSRMSSRRAAEISARNAMKPGVSVSVERSDFSWTRGPLTASMI
jgi:hypothetical protein